MPTSGRRPSGRLQVSFDADVWSQEVERLRARGPMRAAAERARSEIAAYGVPRAALRACSAEGDDGTRLARCLLCRCPHNIHYVVRPIMLSQRLSSDFLPAQSAFGW